jgi:hypothetical protein
VVVGAKIRGIRAIPGLRHSVALQGVITNIEEEHSHTDGYGKESPLTEDFAVDMMRQTFPR